MKKFTKLFLSCALVSALAVTASSAAFAAEEKTITSADGLTGTVAIDDAGAATISDLKVADDVDAGTEVTFLVVKGAVDTTVADTAVMGIDQNTNAAASKDVNPENAGLKTGTDGVVTPETGSQVYTVLVGYTSGGEFKKASGTFTLGEAVGISRIIGDVDFDGEIVAMDATYVARGAIKSTQPKGNVNEKYAVSDPNFPDTTEAIIGDVDLDGEIVAMDATYVARGAIKSTQPKGHVGETIMLGDLIPAAPAE